MKNAFKFRKKTLINPYTITPLAFVLVACLPDQQVVLTKQPIITPLTTTHDQRVIPPVKEPQQNFYGTITSKPDSSNTHELSFQLTYDQPQSFHTQAVTCKAFSHLEIYISGINISNNLYPSGAVNNKVPSGATVGGVFDPCAATATILNVPAGKTRIATVKAFTNNGTTEVLGTTLKAAFDITSSTSTVEISHRSTPVGLVMEDILDDPNQILASQINLSSFQTFINNLTGAGGSFPNFTYSTAHPALVKATVIKDDLVAASGNVSNLNSTDSKYRTAPNTLTVNVSGVLPGDVVSSSLSDPSSPMVVTNPAPNPSFTQTLTGILPGTWNIVTSQVAAVPFASNRTVIVPSITTPTISSASANMSLSPDINLVNSFNTPNSSMGGESSFQINGGNFTGATHVKFNKVDTPSLTVVGPSLITATTPSNLTSGPVTVITPNGEVTGGTTLMALDAKFTVENEPNFQKHSNIVYNPTANEYLVVWEDSRTISSGDIYAQRLNPNGVLIGSEIAVATGVNAQQFPAIAYNNNSNEYLVTWSGFSGTGNNIFAQRLNSSGSLLGSEIQVSLNNAASELNPRVTHNTSANEYLVVWEDERISNPDSQIYGQRVSSAGTLNGAEIAIATGANAQKFPDVAYNSSSNEYLVVWDNNNLNLNIEGVRITAAGAVQSLFPITTDSNAQRQPKVAWNSVNNEYLVAFEDERLSPGTDDIFGQRVSASGSLQGANFAVSDATGNQRGVNLAYNSVAKEYLVTWNDERTGIDVYAQRIRANDGTIIGTDNDYNFLVANSSATSASDKPAVVFNSAANVYMFSYLESSSTALKGRKVDGVDP